VGFMERFTNARAALLGRPDAAAGLAAGLDVKAGSFGPSASLSSDTGWIIRAMGGGSTDAGVAVSEWSAITLPAVYACVSVIADNLAQLPCNLRKQRKDGGSDLADDHPLQRLLHDSPNDEMSSFIWRQTVSHHALMWGNGYSEIERTVGGSVEALLLLYPDRTHPYKPTGKSLTYRTNINGETITLPPADVLHIPALGFDGFLGYSPVAVARNAIGMGLAMEKFGGKFFANDAKSGGFLMHPGKLGDQAQKNVGGSLQDQGGNENAFKVKVLEEGMKFISTTIPQDDAQFLSSREFQVAEIARMYRVPLVLLQSMEKSTSWGSGIEQMMIGFVVWTIQPWVVKWEQELNRKLLSEQERAAGYFFKFNLNALLRGDMKARGQFYKDLEGISALNPNEVRAYEDLNPYEGGDTFRAALARVDASLSQEEIDASAAADAPADPATQTLPTDPAADPPEEA
jgi:HK97 family phage portal protein